MSLLLEIDFTADVSSDVTLASDEKNTLILLGPKNAAVLVELKDSLGGYTVVGHMNGFDVTNRCKQISGPLTYRVRRTEGVPAGVEQVE